MIKQQLQQELRTILPDEMQALNLTDILLETPKQKDHGDYAITIAFQLAKVYKKNPRDIATKIVEKLNMASNKDFTYSDLNGFINIRISDHLLLNYLESHVTQPNFPHSDNRCLLEYVSANPTGPLHIGHGRWAALGDSIKRILTYTKHAVDTEFYINDAGHQINVLNQSITAIKEGKPVPEDGYHGSYIKEMAAQDAPVQYMISEHKRVLKQLDVELDTWFSESTLHNGNAITDVLAYLDSKNYTEIKDKALWFKTTSFGDDKDRVLIKSDGSYTYFLVDIAYHHEKLKRGYQTLVNILGADHHGYVKRLHAAVDALSADSSGTELKVLIGQLVSLYRAGQPVRMSKRTGDMIELEDVIEEIGSDATRFFLIQKAADTPIDFDLQLAKQQNSENPVYYIQYAHARMCSLLRKIEATPSSDTQPPQLHVKERQLLRVCSQLNEVAWEASQHLSPYKLALYAMQLAKHFHLFYEACPIKTATDADKNRRLNTVLHAQKSLAKALSLLGISAPEKM